MFLVIVLAVAALPPLAAHRAAGRRAAMFAGVGSAAWLAVTFGLGASSALARFDTFPAPFHRVMMATTVAVLALTLSRAGKRLVLGVPISALVGFQAFRVIVEIVLTRLHHEGAIPVQMTWEGMNFDVVTGLSALPVAWLAARGKLPRLALAAWNVMGLGLLLTVVTVSMLSAPGPLRAFNGEPALTLVARAPWPWLPFVLVASALAGHVLVFRWLHLHARDDAASGVGAVA
ncbi:Hypothetical protein A7982_05495 [Minicystis rosea]|nr:Hypothetical protein A7982_05495 [Minicystis rosea]